MRVPWRRSNTQQLDLLGDATLVNDEQSTPRAQALPASRPIEGRPATVPVSLIDEDPANPRAESSDAELEELAADIGLRGILVPLVVHPADANGRHLLHFGARRLRAAALAGLHALPVVVRDAPSDRYSQVAENLKRHSLSTLETARFIRDQMNSGHSQTTIAKQLGMNLTSVAHHLSLLDLSPMLEGVLKTGRCTSPRTLHELSKLHERQPEQVMSLINAPGDITREAVAALRARVDSCSAPASTRLIAQAVAACERLEKLLVRIELPAQGADRADLAALLAKVSALSSWSPSGSDGQTP